MSKLSVYLDETGQTQAEFAKRVGTTQANVSKLCKKDNPRISPELAVRIAEVTGGQVPVTAWPKFRAFQQIRVPSSDDASLSEAG